MLNAQSVVSVAMLVGLLAAGPAAQSQESAHEDLSPCTGSAPEPAQSAAWGVAFCNRTGHDLVVEFRDNDCPANNWARRGDVYRKSLRRGEAVTLPLCYANESGKPAALKPGVPAVRIPGGKGVVTTWSVVGDCGERSDHLYLDARSFYDRGDYKTGIILLQHPASASHCADSADSTRPQAQALAGATSTAPRAAAPPPVSPSVATAPPASAPPKAAPPESPAPVFNSGSQEPSLFATVDAHDLLNRTVYVFAKNRENTRNSHCTFTLALTFTDGAGWNDHVQTEVRAGPGDSPVATRKYGKSVTKADLGAVKCAPL
jgi:hypothetical protein